MKYDNLPDTTLSWLAALIDGEGSIMLTSRMDKTKYRANQLRSVVSISNTNLKLLREVVKKTGINRIYKHIRPKTDKNRNHVKTAYTWRMVSTEIKIVLPAVLPWLVIKKKQAKLLLEALRIAEINTPRKGEKFKIVKGTRRHEIHLEIKFLNRKGIQIDN